MISPEYIRKVIEKKHQTEQQKRWEGTPANLREAAEEIVYNPNFGTNRKVEELYNLSTLFFHDTHIAQVLKISNSHVYYHLKIVGYKQ